MSLKCITSSQVLLQYSGLQGDAIFWYTTKEKPWNIDKFKLFSSKRTKDPNKKLSWEFEEQINWRRWLVKGTWTSGSSSNCGDKIEWESRFLHPEPVIDFQVEEGAPIGFPRPSYDFFKNILGGLEFVSIFRPNGRYLIKVDQCGSDGGFNNRALDANVASIELHPGGNSKWWINFYEDDVFHSRTEVWGEAFKAPHHLIYNIDEESEYPASKTFEKELNTEALELREVPQEENQWQVWKIFLNELLEPIEEEIIFSFVGKNPILFCLEDKKCPNNTCKVECENHYCCYNNNGISVYSYPK